jgi:hypothetical protein
MRSITRPPWHRLDPCSSWRATREPHHRPPSSVGGGGHRQPISPPPRPREALGKDPQWRRSVLSWTSSRTLHQSTAPTPMPAREHAPPCSILAPPPPKGTWSSAIHLLLIDWYLVKRYRFGDLILAADRETDGWHFMRVWTHRPHRTVNLFYNFSYRKIIL